MKIKEHFTIDVKFSFKLRSNQDFENYITQLDPKKASVENDIPSKLLVETKEIVSDYIKKISNDSKFDEIFPTSLKLADVMPIHQKKMQRLLKKTIVLSVYYPISPNYLKETCMNRL